MINTEKPHHIYYDFVNTRFGKLLIGASDNACCWISFVNTQDAIALQELTSHFPDTPCSQHSDTITPIKDAIESIHQPKASPISFQCTGTPFQLKVWNTLLTIPYGETRTYHDIATQIGAPTSYRAVGTAIGKNPIAILIPCHRVIRKTGMSYQYRWGASHKKELLTAEGSV